MRLFLLPLCSRFGLCFGSARVGSGMLIGSLSEIHKHLYLLELELFDFV
jgi:hypothetical protein